MASRKVIPVDSLVQLRQRLDRLPPKSPERAAQIAAVAQLNVVAAAVHARRVGAAPSRLFVVLLRDQRWEVITQEDEDQARALLRVYRQKAIPQRRVPEACTPEPEAEISSNDARFALRAEQVLRQVGWHGELFVGVKLVDSTWTRARWDHAQAVLAQWQQQQAQARWQGSGLEALGAAPGKEERVGRGGRRDGRPGTGMRRRDPHRVARPLIMRKMVSREKSGTRAVVRAATAIPRARETVAQSLLEQRDRHRGDDALRHVTRPTTRWWVGRRHPCLRCGTPSRPACCWACCWGAAWLGRAPRGNGSRRPRGCRWSAGACRAPRAMRSGSRRPPRFRRQSS